MAGRAVYVPLDVRCPDPPSGCGAVPGQQCRSLVITGRPFLRRPHAARVTVARSAEERRSQPRAPAGVSDAWTCPEPTCRRSYWAPREWEAELWPPIREQVQRMHGARHERERREREAP
jgi:hypothetical protein